MKKTGTVIGLCVILLVISPIIHILITMETKRALKEGFEDQCYGVISHAQLTYGENLLIPGFQKKTTVYDFGKDKTADSQQLGYTGSTKYIDGGRIIVSENGDVQATFYNEDWCSTYNPQTKEMDTKKYDATCELPTVMTDNEEENNTPPTNTEKEVSLDSDLIKNLHYPYQEFDIPSSEDAYKTDYYKLGSYSRDAFTMQQKIAIAFDHYKFVVEDFYHKNEMDDYSKINLENNTYDLGLISDDTMKTYFAHFWGPDTIYEPTNFTSSFYSKGIYTDGNYQITIPYGIGGAIGPGDYLLVRTIPYKAIIKDNELIIYEYAYFEKYYYESDKYFFYKNNSLTESILGATTREQVEQNKESLNQYRTIFKLHSDGKYYFEKGEWL